MRKNSKRSASLFAAAQIALCGPGCSAFRASTQTVNVSCVPQDAIVTVNGVRVTAPAQVVARRDRDLSVQAHKHGYAPYQRTVGHHLNGTGALDAVGTLLVLVPGIGLLTPGAWSLDETDVAVTLYKE